MNRSDWAAEAACLDEDPDLFFPPGERGASNAQYELARSVCTPCPVRRSCLEFALDVDAQYGMWGGMAPDERKHVKRRFVSTQRRAESRELQRPAGDRTASSTSPFGAFASFGAASAFLVRSRKSRSEQAGGRETAGEP